MMKTSDLKNGASGTSTAANKAIPLRPAAQIMTLARIGSFHQSRLSFMRVLLRRLKAENWQFKRSRWNIDQHGVGVATYEAIGPERSYTLVAFAHDLPAEKRSDRVIAEAWDATFTLHDGVISDLDIQRLQQNVPLQEAGRISDGEFVLSRANRSVRLFDYVRDCLAAGTQPNPDKIEPIGYLMRTTAVYGSGKFGAADRDIWANRPEFSGSFQPELLAVWLIRSFTIDIVEHMAAAKSPETAVKLNPDIRPRIGVGNSTGLGMAPFLINHPSLIHGTFANIRLKNQLLDGVEGGYTLHIPSGKQMPIFDASEAYRQSNTPLIILGGKEYGSGSSRDWAAKGTKLLGVSAVIAESYERIHRSNLIGMGVLPLQYLDGQNAASLGISGFETFNITNIKSGESKLVNVEATSDDGSKISFDAKVRIDTPKEIEYFQHGGILQYVLRQLIRS